MENQESQEKRKSFFVKSLGTIAKIIHEFPGQVLFLGMILGMSIPLLMQIITEGTSQFLADHGLKKIDANISGNIDKAIVQFGKEANKKIPKGSRIVVIKKNVKTPINTGDYIYWKIMQNFIERNDIYVHNNYVSAAAAQDIIEDSGETFTISAHFDEFRDVGFGDDDKFFISMDKISIIRDGNAWRIVTDRSILMREYAIKDKHLRNLRLEDSIMKINANFHIKKAVEKAVRDSLTKQEYKYSEELKQSLLSLLNYYYEDNDSLTKQERLTKQEQECITELKQSLLSFSNYYNEYNYSKDNYSKQIKILFDDKNCTSEECDENGKCEPCTDGECPYDCKSKSKCFSYNYHSIDAFGSADIKSNISIKGCPIGSVWKYNFSEQERYYSVPENPACINITPKRVKDVNIILYVDECINMDGRFSKDICNEIKNSIIRK
jgi:hypothetical protein